MELPTGVAFRGTGSCVSDRNLVPRNLCGCGLLLACSFCPAVYHNTVACTLNCVEPSLAAAPAFPWACMPCLKKGVAAVQRKVLKPTEQGRAARGRRQEAAEEAAKEELMGLISRPLLLALP